MMTSRIYVNRYSWHVGAYLDVTPACRDAVLKELRDAGCSEMRRADLLLRRCDENTGFAYTNKMTRCSVIVVCRSRRMSEVLDTFVHEANHVCSMIEEYYDIDAHGEEASYMIGDIVREIVDGLVEND